MPPMEEIDDREIPAFSRVPQQEAYALLRKEMIGMSVEERQQSLHDIHGVSEDVIHEEPGFVRAKLEEMEMELSKLTMGKEAYMQAEAQSKEYVSCHSLKFLRAEIFDARLAAGRMIRFFEEKKKLFGPDKLTKEIKLCDLDREDQKFLERGNLQILPQRDRAGRRIMSWMLMIRGKSDHNREREEEEMTSSRKMRTLYYLLMAEIEDEETQKKGMVAILVNIGKNRIVKFEKSCARQLSTLTGSLPCRWAALHFCFDDPASSVLGAIVMLMVESRVRARFREHEGTWQEIRYTLMTFGLPVDAFPIKHNEDDFSLDNHIDWLSRREKLEALDNTNDKDEWISEEEPGPLDVLMGRGLDAQVHNIQYRNIIAERQKVYDKSLIYEKTVIAKEIVRLIKESGGRFLRQDGHGWRLVDDKAARVKVSSAFRDRRKSKSAPPIKNAAAAEAKSAAKANENPAKAKSSMESDFARRQQHSLRLGEMAIDPNDTKHLKSHPSP